MSRSLELLERSARLVQTWGHAPLADGPSLSERLTIDGVSWWDVASPNLAAFYLPTCLSATERTVSLRHRIQPYVSWARQRARALRPRARSADACAGWPAAPSCVCLGFSPYMYRDVLKPVAEELARGHRLNVVSLFERESGDAAGTLRQDVWQHWDRDVDEYAAALHAELGRAVASLRATAGWTCAIRDGNESLWTRTRSLFEWLFLVYFPALVPHAALARHILLRHRPALLVSADVDDARNRLYCLTGRGAGVPTLEVQFGMCASDSVEWRFFIADRLAVWGSQARDVLANLGVPADRLALTGSPRYDSVAAPAAPRDGGNGGIREALGIRGQKPLVLFASVSGELTSSEKLSAVKSTIFRAAQAADVVLLVKPHPGEDPRQIRELARGFGNIVFADRRADIRDLIRETDAFVSLGSTAMMDALLAGKPTIWPVLEGLVWWDDPFVTSGAAVVVRSEEALAACFRALQDGAIRATMTSLEPARQRFLADWVHRGDGRASERIAALAVQMAGA